MVRSVNKKENVFQGTERLYVKSAPDLIYFILVLILVALGSVMLFSAGSAYVDENEPLAVLKERLIYLGAGAGIAAICILAISPKWGKIGGALMYLGAVVLLCAVLVIGVTRNGARRWLNFGAFMFQPSEAAKTALILVLAAYFSVDTERLRWKNGKWRSIFYGIVIPGIITAIPCGLILMEKHMSGTLIVAALGILMMFLGGTNILILIGTGAGGAAALGALAWNIEYTRKRIEGLLNRGSNADNDYQTTEGLYAMGTGGFFGRGLGNSQLKYGYIPEVSNDFIFAVVAEELGFFGAVVVILLFTALTGRGIRLSQRSSDRFVSLAVAGLSFKFAIHAILNIGVVAAVLPNTGISLPFFSSGGSATLIQMFDAGVILGLSRYCND